MCAADVRSRVSFSVTKIRRPQLRAGLVGRSALERQLTTALQHGGVVLLSAPGGWGKSVALVRALEALPAGTAVAWVAIDEGDDLARLVACLAAALDPFDLPWRVDPEALARLADRDDGDGIRAVADELVNTLAAADVLHGVLAFDDLHHLGDDGAIALLERLAARLPANWTLAFATRIDPPLSLARLRGRGELAEFRQDALGFAPDEVQALRALIGDARAPEADELLARTQGWPAGLRLVLSSTHPSPGAGARAGVQRYLFDYLAAEVFDTLPGELQRFLLRVSVLSELSASRCAAVAQEARAVQFLEDIERRGLFASVLDVSDELTLRLHDLFRDFLEDRLQREHADELPALLARAAQVEDDLRRRVALLLRAGQPAVAEGALLQAAPGLLASGGGGLLRGLVDQFPAERRAQSPALHFVRGLVAWPRFEWSEMQRALVQAGDGFIVAGHPALAQQAFALASVALTALSRLDEAATRLAQARSAPMSRDTEALCELMSYWQTGARGPSEAPARHLARAVELLHGQPAQVWYRCVPHFLFIGRPGMRRAMQDWVQGAMAVAGDAHAPLRAAAHALQAWLLLWEGRVDEAAALAREVRDEDRWLGQPGQLRMALLALQSGLAAVQGDVEGCRSSAQAMLDDLDHDADRAATWRGLYLYQCIRLADGMGDTEWADKLHAVLQAQPAEREWPLMKAARATLASRRALAAGHAYAAAAVLQPWVERIDAVDMISAAADLRLALADALLACGQSRAAWDALEPALIRAHDAGETMPLRLAGDAVLRRLADGPWPEDAPPELLALLGDARGEPLDAPRPAAPAAGPEGLTVRELQICERIAAGDSNKLIARAFELSPHTVKRHVANILDKLALASRGQVAAWFLTQPRA